MIIYSSEARALSNRGSSLFVCSSFEELEVPVSCFWGEGEFCLHFGGDSAAVAEDGLDLFLVRLLAFGDRTLDRAAREGSGQALHRSAP